MTAIFQQKQAIKGVKHIIAVASGKGGVGKSTVAVNLAIAAANLSKQVSILDADLFGPSIPKMLNLNSSPIVENAMSIGFLVKDSDAVVWRGLMVTKALNQLIRNVDWSDTDLLIIDMPPGTGDTQLTITQHLPLSGALIVSTPQDIALADAIKACAMFRKVKVPLLGLVQNMSFFHCQNCKTDSMIFGKSDFNLKKVSENYDMDILGEFSLDPRICEGADCGTPIVVMEPDGVHGREYTRLARSIFEKLDLKKKV